MADLELTVKQVADALGKSERTVRRYIAQGRLRARKVTEAKEGGPPARWLIDAATVRSMAADLGRKEIGARFGQAAIDELRSLRREIAEQREQIARLTHIIERLEQKALPAAAEEQRVSWWRRVFGPKRTGRT